MNISNGCRSVVDTVSRTGKESVVVGEYKMRRVDGEAEKL